VLAALDDGIATVDLVAAVVDDQAAGERLTDTEDRQSWVSSPQAVSARKASSINTSPPVRKYRYQPR
jgi:hypothetical protein